jgi:hypothetical protein
LTAIAVFWDGKKAMSASIPEARQQIHELVERLGPDHVEAVLSLLKAVIDAEDETLTEQDRRAVEASRDYFRRRPEEGVPFEQFAAECGFTMDQILDHKN